MIIYCRGCSREFTPSSETETDYIELSKGGAYYHPKCDTDIIDKDEIKS